MENNNAPAGCPVTHLMDLSNFREGAPYPLFHRCRQGPAVCWEAEGVSRRGGHWNVFRRREIDQVMKHPELFSNTGGPFLEETPPELLTPEMQSLNLMDPPRHRSNRSLVDYAFKPAAIRRKEEDLRRIARELIAAMADRTECDFVADFASQLPLRVICDILGVPEDERQHVYDIVNQSVLAQDPDFAGSREEGFDAHAQIIQYGTRLASAHREQPRDSLTSEILAAKAEGQRMSDHEYGLLFHNLIVGGIETTRNAMAFGLYELIRHPDQLALLQREPERIGDAVEEILRYHAPTVYYRRTALQDTELGGQRIHAGDTVICWLASANRDEHSFSEPEQFDITRNQREPVRRHYRTFGVGPHFCLGVHLARLELQIAFEELLAQLTGFALEEPPTPAVSMFNDGFKRMPIRFARRQEHAANQ